MCMCLMCVWCVPGERLVCAWCVVNERECMRVRGGGSGGGVMREILSCPTSHHQHWRAGHSMCTCMAHTPWCVGFTGTRMPQPHAHPLACNNHHGMWAAHTLTCHKPHGMWLTHPLACHNPRASSTHPLASHNSTMRGLHIHSRATTPRCADQASRTRVHWGHYTTWVCPPSMPLSPLAFSRA